MEKEEYISRKLAKKKVDVYLRRWYGAEVVNAIQDVLEDIPSVDVKLNKNGKWVYMDDSDTLYCSECKSKAYLDSEDGQQKFDYCPYCGAKMRK